MIEIRPSPQNPTEPVFDDAQFDFGGMNFGPEESDAELTDEAYMSALCGAVADIIDKRNAPAEEGGLTNKEIFSRLQGVFDASSERWSADLAKQVEASIRIAEAIGHAACGDEAMMQGAQSEGLISETLANRYKQNANADRDHTAKKDEKKKLKKDKKKPALFFWLAV